MENKIRLNNFILWCKGWYQPVNKNDIINDARKILTLDGYLSCNNTIYIALNYIDDLVKSNTITPINLACWNEGVIRYMNYYGMSYSEALIYKIREFFAYECPKLPLNPPIYSRKLYKLGFVAPKHFGNSYKLANYKVNKFFGKHYER